MWNVFGKGQTVHNEVQFLKLLKVNAFYSDCMTKGRNERMEIAYIITAPSHTHTHEWNNVAFGNNANDGNAQNSFSHINSLSRVCHVKVFGSRTPILSPSLSITHEHRHSRSNKLALSLLTELYHIAFGGIETKFSWNRHYSVLCWYHWNSPRKSRECHFHIQFRDYDFVRKTK